MFSVNICISSCYVYSQAIQKSTNDTIKTTSSDIKKLNSIVKFSSTEKSHQLMLEKIVSEFHTIVQKYLQSEKSLALKMKKTLLVNFQDDSSDEDVNVSQQQKQLMQADLDFDKELLVEREQQFQKIESDVVDINQIMNEISTLIHGKPKQTTISCWNLILLKPFSEQGEGVQTIDNTITQVADDVEGGVSELQKAASHQQKFRRKVLIVLIIALIIAFLVVFSLYSKLKN